MNIRSATANALRWSLGTRLVVQLLLWGSTLLVIRLLQPDDYGVMAMVMSVVMLANRVTEGGLTASVIQKKEIGKDELDVVMTFSGLISLLLFGLIFVSAPYISWFYGEEITLVLRITALTLPLRSIGRIQEALLIREFDFRRRSLIETTALLVNGLVTLCLALFGFQVWSLVLGALAGATARAIGFMLSHTQRTSLNFNLAIARGHLGFSAAILGQRILSWANGFCDIILIGRFFDPAILGIYNTAKEIAYLPQSKVAAILNQVTFATFSRLQGEQARARGAVRRSIEMLSSTMFPVFFAISAYAPEFQRLVLGNKWAGIVLPLQILAFAPPARMINSHLIELLNGLGHPHASTRNMLTGLVLALLAFSVGLSMGVIGVALAAVVTYPILSFLLMNRLVGIGIVGWQDLVRPLLTPLLASVAAWIMVMVLREALTSSLPAWQALSILVAGGSFTYIGLMTVIAPSRLQEVASFIRA